LAEFDTTDHLPNRILMCGGGASLEALTKRLSTANWYTDLPFTRRPIVQLIKPENVSGIDDETGEIRDHTMITALGLLRVGYDTIDDSNDDSISGKLNKILRI